MYASFMSLCKTQRKKRSLLFMLNPRSNNPVAVALLSKMNDKEEEVLMKEISQLENA